MTSHSQMMMQASEISISAGEDHDKKNNSSAAAMSYNMAVQCSLSAAVNEFDSVTDGVGFIKTGAIPDVLRRVSELESTLVETKSGSGAYGLIVNAHIASLLNDSDVMNLFLRTARHEAIRSEGSDLWNSYCDGFVAIVSGERYSVPKLDQLRDLEKYWFHHLEFLSAVSAGENLEDACLSLGASFKERNSDRTLRDDGKKIEGTGNGPVKWDFRVASWNVIIESVFGSSIQGLSVDWPFRW